MKQLLACVASLVLAVTFGGFTPAAGGQFATAVAVEYHLVAPVAPEAPVAPTKKKTPKPTATPSPTPASTTPTGRARSAADEDGDRWVQLAMIAGGGLLGSVLVFFGIGALLRRRRPGR